MKNKYPLEQAVERLQEAALAVSQGSLICAASGIGAAMDAIAAYQDKQKDLIEAVTWMLVEIDWRNKQSGMNIEDSPEVAKVRALLEAVQNE